MSTNLVNTFDSIANALSASLGKLNFLNEKQNAMSSQVDQKLSAQNAEITTVSGQFDQKLSAQNTALTQFINDTKWSIDFGYILGKVAPYNGWVLQQTQTDIDLMVDRGMYYMSTMVCSSYVMPDSSPQGCLLVLDNGQIFICGAGENAGRIYYRHQDEATEFKQDGRQLINAYKAGNAVSGESLPWIKSALAKDIPVKTSDIVNDSGFATSAYVSQKFTDLIGGAPEVLDTLKEISDALSGDSNFAATMLEKLDGKADSADSLSGYGIQDAYTKSQTDALFEQIDFAAKFNDITSKINALSGQSAEVKQEASKNTIDILMIQNKLDTLQAQLQRVQFADAETVYATSGLNNPDKDLIIALAEPISVQTTIAGKSIAIKDMTIDSAHTDVTATGDVSISNLTTQGELAKQTSNSMVSINTSEYVKITDSNFGHDGYNAIQIGLNGQTAPKSVLIDGITFEGQCQNNTISIFGTQDNAVITISNCVFNGDCSNPIRLSNKTNSHVTVNLVNCKFNGDWDRELKYHACILCQDYTSTDAQQTADNNLFAPEKVKINFINCYKQDNVKIFSDDVSDIAGHPVRDQLVYVYYNKHDKTIISELDNNSGYLYYTQSRYPEITFS